MNTTESKTLAELLFPDITSSIEEYSKVYTPRDISDDAKITRFGPSPTGFLHIGGIFTALISERIAHQSDGVFILRIEDTDKTREVENGITQIVTALNTFNIQVDEGLDVEGKNFGAHGPYKQSERLDIYKAFAKSMIENGTAYPCFCSTEELEIIRNEQESQKIRPGYYGTWAKHRDLSFDEIKERLSQEQKFVIRLKSDGDEKKSFTYNDLVKGKISVTENNNDIVLIKADGYPTYHFAHVVDEFLMKITHVIRGDEWLSSLPIHLQISKYLNIQAPHYAHIAPILKSEDGKKRKLSKRKDPESSVDFYFETGYPVVSIVEYLLNIANSNFEDWRRNNPDADYTQFGIRLEKLSKSGALFDLNKLNDISKEIISKMSAQDVFDNTLIWAKMYNSKFAELLEQNKDYCLAIFSIERGGVKPRKDFACWSQVEDSINYFFNEYYAPVSIDNSELYPKSLTIEDIKNILTSYIDFYTEEESKEAWFESLKNFADSIGFASNPKDFKNNPTAYKGHVGDVAMVLRVTLTGRTQTPDLFEMMKVMGKEEVNKRLKQLL